VAERVLSADAELVGNRPLEELMEANFQRLGPPRFAAADHDFAKRIQATLSPEDIASAYRRGGIPPAKDEALAERLMPLDRPLSQGVGSTDVGSVSWKVPTVQARGATHAVGTPGHSWQIVAQGQAGAAHKGLEHVAKVMAGTAADLFARPETVAAAKAEHAARTADSPSVFPIPKGVAPPFDMAKGH
jgi:aminobenzoyl-glutamate utilization protein B